MLLVGYGVGLLSIGRPFGDPARVAAVEQRHVLVARPVQHPPQARRPHDVARAVEHHQTVVVDAVFAEFVLQLLRARQRKRQRACGVGQPACEVEHARRRNVRSQIVVAPALDAIPRRIGAQVHGGIENPQTFVAPFDAVLDVFGGRQIFRVAVIQFTYSAPQRAN